MLWKNGCKQRSEGVDAELDGGVVGRWEGGAWEGEAGRAHKAVAWGGQSGDNGGSTGSEPRVTGRGKWVGERSYGVTLGGSGDIGVGDSFGGSYDFGLAMVSGAAMELRVTVEEG